MPGVGDIFPEHHQNRRRHCRRPHGRLRQTIQQLGPQIALIAHRQRVRRQFPPNRRHGQLFAPAPAPAQHRAENQFDRHIGFCFAAFDLPNTFALQDEALAANTPGKLFSLVATRRENPVHVFFTMAHPPLSRAQGADPAFQRALFRDGFAGWGWHVPAMLDAMDRAQDLYCDEVKQIRTPAYTRGRAALVGDAAAAPSFLTGQGTSLAVVGAYLLACTLSRAPDHPSAFAAYDRAFRPFAEANQNLIGTGETLLIPKTQAGIDARNAMLAAMTGPMEGDDRPEHSLLDLSAWDALAG